MRLIGKILVILGAVWSGFIIVAVFGVEIWLLATDRGTGLGLPEWIVLIVAIALGSGAIVLGRRFMKHRQPAIE